MSDPFSVTIFGTSPRFLTEIHNRGIHPRTSTPGPPACVYHNDIESETVDLSPFASLRILFSTGSVLTAPMFEWTQGAFGGSVHIASSSGGTDICSCCEYKLLLMLKLVV